jgi:hypothetical protein
VLRFVPAGRQQQVELGPRPNSYCPAQNRLLSSRNT